MPDAPATRPDRIAFPATLGACIALPLLFAAAIQLATTRLPAGMVPIGFVHQDDPVYYACAREYFENGNGFTCASPYSADPASPRIYSHLVFLLVGWIWRLTGIGLPVLDAALRVLFGAAMLATLAALVRRALPDPRERLFATVLALAGGGLAWLGAGWACGRDYLLASGQPGFSQTFAAWLRGYPDFFGLQQGGYGEWHMDVVSNLVSTMECAYHTLFFAGALALLSCRWRIALVIQVLAWWAHPFTGTEFGFLALAFVVVEQFAGRRPGWNIPAASASINAAFLAYNLLFLPAFPEHASVAAQIIRFGNPFQFGMIAPAFGLLAILPLGWVAWGRPRADLRENAAARLFATWFVVVTALVLHDRLGFGFQAMHFTRGYLYVPLAYFSARGLRAAAARHGIPWNGRRSALGLAAVAMLHLPDPWLALRNMTAGLPDSCGVFAATPATLGILEALNRIPGSQTVVAPAIPGADAGTMTALIPVLTPHRPVNGHQFNTPHIEGQRAALKSPPRPLHGVNGSPSPSGSAGTGT